MTSRNWHPADVIATVRKTGSTMQEIAFAAGFARSATSHCLRWPVPHANHAIAKHLGLSVHDIWPEWFDADGELKPRDRKRITTNGAAQRQKRSAA